MLRKYIRYIFANCNKLKYQIFNVEKGGMCRQIKCLQVMKLISIFSNVSRELRARKESYLYRD